MEIRFVSRQEIIDSYLDRVFNGYELSRNDKAFITNLINGT